MPALPHTRGPASRRAFLREWVTAVGAHRLDSALRSASMRLVRMSLMRVR